MHIYETAGWTGSESDSNWFEDDNQGRFIEIVKKYHDRIPMEVTGHEHLSGMRTHSLGDGTGEQYLNKVIFPSITASTPTNPGFGTFEYDTETSKVSKLKFTYIDVDATIGYPKDTPVEELPWMDVDFEAKFGLMDASGESIYNLAQRLLKDPEMAREFEFNRMGVDPSNER